MALPAMVTPDNAGLLIDQYELRMVQAYLHEGMVEPAGFDVFVRTLPAGWNFLLACGIESALDLIEHLRFEDESLDRLCELGLADDKLCEFLRGFRFKGDVRAVREGTPIFPGEPIMEVIAPLPEAQLIETLVLNQVTFQTALASKAARIARAADGRAVVDFGLRRVHGLDAGLKSAHAFGVAGIDSTSNVLGGLEYGLGVTGTMAHSYIEAHEDELRAFEAFARRFDATVLLLDTYDTVEAAHRVVELSRRMGDSFTVRGVRLDSGDLADLARRVRTVLDEGGLDDVSIFASGGLDEASIASLIASRAPIDGFGVGTRMGVPSDGASLDSAYKLVEYAGTGRMKLSSGKDTLPGRKQVYRMLDGDDPHDLVCKMDEERDGTPLLESQLHDGQRCERLSHTESTRRGRERAGTMLGVLPARLGALDRAEPTYPVRVSPALQAEASRIERRIRGRSG